MSKTWLFIYWFCNRFMRFISKRMFLSPGTSCRLFISKLRMRLRRAENILRMLNNILRDTMFSYRSWSIRNFINDIFISFHISFLKRDFPLFLILRNSRSFPVSVAERSWGCCSRRKEVLACAMWSLSLHRLRVLFPCEYLNYGERIFTCRFLKEIVLQRHSLNFLVIPAKSSFLASFSDNRLFNHSRSICNRFYRTFRHRNFTLLSLLLLIFKERSQIEIIWDFKWTFNEIVFSFDLIFVPKS